MPHCRGPRDGGVEALVPTSSGDRDNTKAYPSEEEAEGVRRALVERLATENIASVGGVTFRQHGTHCLDRRERNGVRGVPLFGMAHESACQWLELLPKFAPKNPFGLLWPGKNGGRIPRSKTYYSDSTMPAQNKRGHKGFDFRDALKAAGITRRVRWHDLRHTCASSLVAGWWGGRPWRLEEVREMLGHTSISVTERYAHFAPGALRNVANATRPTVHPLSTTVGSCQSRVGERGR